MSLSTNTTYRVYVEKLGASDPTQFVGDEGELFYDPSSPSLFLSDGSTPGGVAIAGGGGGSSQWGDNVNGIYYNDGNVAIGTNVVGSGSTVLMVHGDARITGILSVGNATITLDPNTNTITADTVTATTFAIGAGSTTLDTSKWIITYGDIGIGTAYQWNSSARFDSQGKIYVTGNSEYDDSGWKTNPYVIKFDTDGSIIWQKFFDHPDPDRSYKVCKGLGVNKNTDEVYVAVSPDDTVGSAILVKLNSNGDILWQQEVDDVYYEVGVTIAVASSGNVYLGGLTDSQGAGGYDFFVVKFDSDGNEIWQRTIGNNNYQYSGQVAVDSDENLYCSFDASFMHETNNFNLFLIKLDSDGNELWQRYIDMGGYEYSYGVAVDSQNNPYVVGSGNDPNDDPDTDYDATLVKFDSDGNLVWQRTLAKSDYQDGISIAIDENDLIYIQSANYAYNGFYTLSSFNSDGNLLWNKDVKYSLGDFNWSYYWGINYLDVHNGQLALSGYTYTSEEPEKGFVMRIPTSGEGVDGLYGDYQIVSSNPVVSISTYSVGISTLTVGISTLPISAAGLTTATPPEQLTTEVNYKKLSSDFNTIVSDEIFVNDFTLNNLPFGKSSGSCGNFIVGNNAGRCNTTGSNNNFFGRNAGYNNSSGNANNFLGFCAGYCNTVGSYNNFLGRSAGFFNSTGWSNNIFGVEAGVCNTTGSYNNFFGRNAGYFNTTGCHNTFIGFCAGRSNTTGSCNNFFGIYAGRCNTTGNSNNFFGQYAGYCNTNGCNNTFIGNRSGASTSASRKIILGSGSQYGISPFFDAPDTTKDMQFAVGLKTDSNPSKYWLVGNENFNVGIGTTNPTTKLQVGGDVKVGVNTSEGVILTSPDGTAYRIIVNNGGTLTTVAV